MPYATQADMVARYGQAELQQLSDLDGMGAIDAVRLAQALQDASDEIDGYLAGRYALPLAAGTAPRILTLHCCTVALFNLARMRPGASPTDEMRTAYDQALKYLDTVATGRLSLGLAPNGAQPPATGGAVTVAPGGRKFSDASLRDYTCPPLDGGYGFGRP